MPPRAPLLGCRSLVEKYTSVQLQTHLTLEGSKYRRREIERTQFYVISYYQSFENGSKRLINETTLKPTSFPSRLESTMAVPSAFCTDYSYLVEVKAVGKVLESSPTVSSCSRYEYRLSTRSLYSSEWRVGLYIKQYVMRRLS